jgi:hypothetical protein
MTHVWTCDEAVARLLEPEGAPAAELAAHLETCAECRHVARDVSALQALIAEARADVDRHLEAPDVLAATSGTPDGRRTLRLVQGAAAPAGQGPPGRRGALGPVAPAHGGAAPRRMIPLAIAVAAGLVAVTATAVLLREDAPRPEPRERVVLRDTGEREPAPERPTAPAEPAAIAVAPAPAPPAPAATAARHTEEGGAPGEPAPGHRVPQGSKERRPSVPSAPTPRTPSSTPASSPSAPRAPDEPSPEIQAQRTLRGRMPRLQSCYERALRRDLRLGDATADLTVDISAEGAVQSVTVSGDATTELRRCLEQTVRNARFPGSETGLRVSVPLRFEVVRERMGTNVRPRGTVPE